MKNIVLFLFLTIVAMTCMLMVEKRCAFLVCAEDVTRHEKYNISYRTNDVLGIFDAEGDKFSRSSDDSLPERGSYEAWALSNLVRDRFARLYNEDRMFATLDEFCTAVLPEMAQIREKFGARDPRTTCAQFLLYTMANNHFQIRSRIEKDEEKKRVIETCIDELKVSTQKLLEEARDNINSISNVIALTLFATFPGFYSRYVGCEQRPGPPAAFVLVRLDDKPEFEKPKKKIELMLEYTENLNCPLNTAFNIISGEEKEMQLSGIFHPTIAFSSNAVPRWIAQGSTKLGFPTTSEFLGAGLMQYFDGLPFLHYYYGGNAAETLSSDNGLFYSPKRTFSHYPFLCDIRGIRLDRKLTVSGDMSRLVDRSSPAYSRIMKLCCRCDHMEDWSAAGFSRATLERSGRLAVYNDYLSKCEAIVVAMYDKTVVNKVWSAFPGEGHSRECEFLTPDYSTTPTICLAYVPKIWRRLTCYLGAQKMLFDYNPLGLREYEVKYPKQLGY